MVPVRDGPRASAGDPPGPKLVLAVDAIFATYENAAQRLAAAGVAPPGTLLGVSRLAFPELMVELEGTAAS